MYGHKNLKNLGNIDLKNLSCDEIKPASSSIKAKYKTMAALTLITN